MKKPETTGTLKWLFRLLLPLLFVCIVILLLNVPFLFPTQTLWYKYGIDRGLLIGGQMAGLFCFFLILIQVLSGVRVKLLEFAYGTARTMKFHRLLGPVILVLALAHAGLILLPEGLTNLPIGWKFWPEMLGVTVLILLLVQVSSSWLRNRFGLNYRAWRVFHRLLAYLALLLGMGHIFFVSDSFGWERPGKFLIFLVAMILLVVGKTRFSRK